MKTEEPTIKKKSNENLKHVHHRCSCYKDDFVFPCDYEIRKRAKLSIMILFISGQSGIKSEFKEGGIIYSEDKK